MNQPSVSVQRGPVRARTRRTLLAGIVASCVTTWVPGTTRRPMPAELATALPAPESFVALSKFLTGQASLDLALADRLYQALLGNESRFPEQLRRLLAFIRIRHADPLRLQQRLDDDEPQLAPVPRRIVKAWYTGIVGEGARAQCIAFETSLLYVITADKLKPPSYAYGAYGSWAARPV
ncbi:sugar dehydrogenase complex small subunit [Caballeronia sp. LZ034LL]|uniref:sugar dehydrogenase complex small subunit n=1 Tax=Caballeronia sp. LZ034LL TaxID=3038567 RepID=UPI0028578DB9|nr:sugar dehydrogenase complex small subunit [Caballeronia sp. LZ034LL]MDR5838810.1 sugar dehydrogenase complex small subunit [Caballeronia sp. LZ034LL]